ncbi:MAG: phosphoribosylformylglycinamidine synthase [Phycisphaerales bacterium]|nr:MAG: phosphoribosylformylglycinamidine synthase [Phycisphaerales bacterium]
MTGATVSPSVKVHRIEVAPRRERDDVRGAAVERDAAAIGVRPGRVRTARVYLVRADLSEADLDLVRDVLLANPVLEAAAVGAAPTPAGARTVEIHPLPGVMDPVAQTVRQSVIELTGVGDVEVSTGLRYDLFGVSERDAETLAARLLANPVVQRIHLEPYEPADFLHGDAYELRLARVTLRGLDDKALEKLSREAHLFLSLDEMRAVRDFYESQKREPTDIELETLAQTWSEHCVHKTLKSTITYTGGADDVIDWSGRPGHERMPDGSVLIHNLLKSTVAAATFELIDEGVDWTLSVFKDNAGVIAFDDDHAVCVKVETHNHPSAIEPYGGAATGVGGCIRDVMGTGLGAKPIANTDVFCVAFPDNWAQPGAPTQDAPPGTPGSSGTPGSPGNQTAARTEGGAAPVSLGMLSAPAFDAMAPAGAWDLPTGCLHPARVLRQVVAGVRDYGNRMGIPTVNGAVWFDDRHIGNPLVFCGCIGVMPRDKVEGDAQPGDLIVALGGRTGRDGIHGATFSSAELTDTHADEFAHAVQIGNAITEKRTLDAILRARDAGPGGASLFSAITDCGAGGFSSAVGEMGAELGAEVHLERAPLKYDGLSYTEIWISEAQERMVLAVPPGNLDALRAICDEESCELSVLGTFGTPGEELILRYNGEEVGRLSMRFLHDGIPTPTRRAEWKPDPDRAPKPAPVTSDPNPRDTLLHLLAHPNIASKHWIIRQYDHEVQGGSVIKPLVGPEGEGPGDASVITPVEGSTRGLAIACGLATGIGDPMLPGALGDPYLMALAAIDECVRNLVCVGADPDRIAILDNFCWPSCAKPENLGSLVRAAEGCYDGAKAYRTPFVSGKDSLNNQFTTDDGRTIEIPPTLLISGIGIVPDVLRCATMDAKQPGRVLVLVGETGDAMGGSHHQRAVGAVRDPNPPRTDLALGPAAARFVASLVRTGAARSAHDVSDGGALVAVAEMLIAGSTKDAPIGAALEPFDTWGDAHVEALLFGESPSRYVLEMTEEDAASAAKDAPAGVPVRVIARLDASGTLRLGAGETVSVESLREAWMGTLDW